MVQCFMLSVGFHKRQTASFNLTNHRLVMNADVRCKNAGVRRVFNGNLSAAVIGRTELHRKMRGYPLIGASQINSPPSEWDVCCFRAILAHRIPRGHFLTLK